MLSKKLGAVYSAAIIQGIALVAFPAAGAILTKNDGFHFSSTEYGSLFIPQAVLAIIFAILSAKLAQKSSIKTIFILGLLCTFISMSLLASSASIMHSHSYAHRLLLIATSFLGIGFGLTVPTINTMTALLRPLQIDFSILILNSLLGMGTALAPVFITIFTGLGFWWGLPLFLAIFTGSLILFSLFLPLPDEKIKPAKQLHGDTHYKHLWIFSAFALLYGIIETLNGNWIAIYMKEYQNADTSMQSLALTIFWSMVTLGRIFFAWSHRYIQERLVYQILPLFAALAFLLIQYQEPNNLHSSLFIFGLSGFACSALLPLTISFAKAQLQSPSATGNIIAFYLLGYGIAAFGVGPLQDYAKWSLKTIYGYGIIAAILLSILSIFLCKKK